MTGQKIKDILRSEGITIADVARMLGHNGDQRLHSALKSEDVKSGLIEDIARVTNKSVCYFYEGSGNTVATDTVSRYRVIRIRSMRCRRNSRPARKKRTSRWIGSSGL